MEPLVSVVIVTSNRKGDAIECIDSVLNSSYKPIEIIVVDNASTDNTAQELQQRYSDNIKLIKSAKNLYAGGGRNLGAKLAKGEYLLFIDSDNVVDKDMVKNMIEGIQRNKDMAIGLSGPFTYYKSSPNRLCWVNNRISMLTSITVFSGSGEINDGQYDKASFIKVGHIPNVFMVNRDIFREVGGIDEEYVMHYEESDLAEKIKRTGYEIVLFPQAKTWHKLPLKSERGHKSFQGRNPNMVYYVSRNRIFFMRKNSRGLRLFLFMVIFSNLFLVYNLTILLLNRRFGLIKLLLNGYIDGIVTPVTKRAL